MKKISKSKVKRLGIFACSDEKEGKIDRYIFYLLNDIKENLDDLIVVVNGKLQPESRWKLSEVTPHVVTREDKGLDPAAYQFAMIEYCGWDKVQEYDEIVMFNDTFFGPFYPFKEVFEEMADRDCDFWGLTPHHEIEDPTGWNPYGYFPEHVELYFLVVRKSMHHSYEFRCYWENLPIYDNYYKIIAKHESYFTKYFSDMGFSYSLYCDISDRESNNRAYNYNTYLYEPYWLLKEKKYPVYKRKNLALPLKQYLEFSYGNEQFKSLTYIKEHYKYDMSLIWENVLRIYNIYDIFESLGLEYALSKTCAKNHISDSILDKILIVLHVTYVDKLDFLKHYLNIINDRVDVIITTHSEQFDALCELSSEYKRVKIRCVENRGRDVSALLIGIKEDIKRYEYICFNHDKKSKQVPTVTGEDFQYLLWDNLLASWEYIENVITLFENNQHLGLAVPPVPSHGLYSIILGSRWTVNFDNVKKISERLGLNVPIESSKPTLSIGAAFWCRKKALEKMWSFPWEYRDFSEEPRPDDGELGHSIERILPYIAQQSGYYTGWIMTEREAVIEARNMRYMVEKMIYHMRFDPKGFPGFNIAGVDEKVPENYYNHFFPYHLFYRGARVALYGAGNIGKQFYRQAMQDDYVNIVGIVDRDAANIHVAGIPVQPIDQLRNMSFDYVLITMNRPPVAESGKQDILALGIPENKIKWDGEVYYRDHFYQKYYFNLMDRSNPNRLPYLQQLR